MKNTRQIYCQYLISSQINYTCTNLADHTEGLDYNSVYRYLKGNKLTPALIWEKVKDHLVTSENGYLIYDVTRWISLTSLRSKACAANIG